MGFLDALGFLTILPMPRQPGPEELGRTVVYFPVVGIIIGLVLLGLNWLLGLVLPPALVNVLLIVALVGISGALHLDGFVDTCDGLGGNRTAGERWQLMRDSRTGAFGVIGAVCLLLVKYISLNCVPAPVMVATLVMMPVVSRWAMVYAIFAYPYAKQEGLGLAFKQGANLLIFITATLITLAVVVVSARLVGLVIMLGTWVIVIVAAAYFRRKFAGLTGDNYGAISELAEVCVLVMVCLLTYNQWLWLI